MIHKLLMKLSTELQRTPEGNQELRAYQEMHKSKGWAIHQGMLVAIGNEISLYMLSGEYTKLDAREKDIQQRAFFMIKEVIEFLMNPMRAAERRIALDRAAERMREQATPQAKP